MGKRVWVFQDHRKKKRLGVQADWLIGWREDGKRRSKLIGGREEAEEAARSKAAELGGKLQVTVETIERLQQQAAGALFS